MAQITLSDYVGFIFGEIVKARALADAESKRIALLYKDDEILKNFSVPRFKIPEMDLAIPVLISGARYNSVLRFTAKEQAFVDYMNIRLNNVVTSINIAEKNIKNNFESANDPIFVYVPPRASSGVFESIAAQPVKTSKSAIAATGGIAVPKASSATVDVLIIEFYKQLLENPDPSTPENIVQIKWAQLFNRKIEDNRLQEAYKRQYPAGQLYTETYNTILAYVKANTVVESTSIDNLLVNPETQTVKDGSNADSVFMIKAKIVEDGLFIKEIKDDQGNVTERFVEFD